MKMDMQKKLSYYTIFTDEISETLKSRIVFSTITGKAVIVDEAIYTSLINNDFGSIANDVLERLIQEQFLVDVNENELEKIIKENKQTANDDKLNTTRRGKNPGSRRSTIHPALRTAALTSTKPSQNRNANAA